MKGIFEKVKGFIDDESGLTTVEYAVAGALVAAVTVAAFQALGLQVMDVIYDLESAIGGDGAPTSG